MPKINLLSEELCNRIAAGEVIDRPYSVVKEMIENSIDACATDIEIRIDRGGKDLIEIVDNGCGIEYDDLRMALIPHATSKISKLEDIEHIHTLGFRGEALATIASVALVELISSVDGEHAFMVESDGNYVGKVSPAPITPKGTRIAVRNLFFNTPVRYKFLKSNKKEVADITSYVTRYILANPDIAFRLIVDGKMILQSYGDGMEEAITQVYGADFLPNCYKVLVDRNNILISGFISNQNFFKPNKTYQSIFLNGRIIENSVISGAINNAYSAYAMKRQYPFYALHVIVEDDIVDVNVHPNKSDVRFTDNSLIYGTLYKTISEILDGTAKAAEFVVKDEDGEIQKPAYAANYTQTRIIFDKDFNDVAGIEKYAKNNPPKQIKKPTPYDDIDLSPYEDYPAPKFEEIPAPYLSEYQFFRSDEDIALAELSTRNDVPEMFLESFQDEIQLKRKAEQEEFIFRQSKYRGQLFNTYLIYEVENDVYIIDQHAAHERVLYDKLMKQIKHKKINRQSMLVPYIFSVNAEEKEFIDNNRISICKAGFQLEPFGHKAYKLDVIPYDLYDLNFKEFIDDLLSQIHSLKEIKIEEIFHDKIAQTACKHAVKGGRVLTEKERDALFEDLRGNMGLKCPHGRPVCIKMTKSEVEKLFKRKV